MRASRDDPLRADGKPLALLVTPAFVMDKHLPLGVVSLSNIAWLPFLERRIPDLGIQNRG